ncbi:MAG: flagellar filament capping protein FliD [Pseudomonadaceae bacterium]|nr:flagellar filament capping protein FliD [Pseudomonadaceae bacterium]
MVSSINTSGISVGSDGKVKISGLSSSIDSQAIIDAAVTARRIPAVKLESKITANQDLISAYGELKTLASSVTTALDQLRGSNSFLSDNVFRKKSVSGSTLATDTAPATHVPSDISSLINVTVQNSAQNASHTITIQQLAKAHQLRSDSFSSTGTALATLGATTGDFDINGVTINLDGDDTLVDLRGKINAANAGVTATIVSADASTHYLVITSDDTGLANTVDFAGGNAISDSLGLTNLGAVKNELVAAKDAIVDVDGITGITRSSNDIDDVIEGVTLSLLKAEVDTEINLKVEPDLVSIKGAVVDLVTAYNDVRTFYDDQRTTADRNGDGAVGDSEFGPLARDNVLRQMVDKLGQFAAGEVSGNTDGYRSLSQLGITVTSDYKLQLDDAVFDAKLIGDVDSVRALFGFEFTSSDARLNYLGRTDATQSGTYYVNIGGTDVDGNITSANIQTAAVVGNGGADDGSLTVSAKQAYATNGTAAEGLNLFFNGTGSLGAVDDIAITISRGLADSFYDYFNDITKLSGTVDTRVQELGDTNAKYQEDIDKIDVRIETYRQTMELKFVRMETALAQLESLKQSLSSYFDASNSSNN